MPNKLTLTTFVDFVSKSGPPKITVVRHFKRGSAYHPAFDFYKGARDAIVGFHRHARPKKALDAMVTELRDPKKAGAYAAIARGHRKFVGRRKMRWFDPPVGTWNGGGIAVHVNPELGLEIGGVPYVVKLYFKEERLPRRNVAIIRRVMEESLREADPPPVFAVLDVRRGVLHAPTTRIAGLDALLAAEADAFARILASL
jgi:hypothetical protein